MTSHTTIVGPRLATRASIDRDHHIAVTRTNDNVAMLFGTRTKRDLSVHDHTSLSPAQARELAAALLAAADLVSPPPSPSPRSPQCPRARPSASCS